MLFSSIPFLYCFLPLVVLVYFLVPRRFKNAVLLLFSLVFYGWGEPKYVYLMIATILMFYGTGIGVGRSKPTFWKKFWVVVAAEALAILVCLRLLMNLVLILILMQI